MFLVTPLPIVRGITRGNIIRISSAPSPSSSLSLPWQKLPSLRSLSPSPSICAHPIPLSLLRRHFHALFVRSCPFPNITITAAVLLQTACFAVTIVFSRPPPFLSLPRGLSPPGRCPSRHGQCHRHGRCPSPPPFGSVISSR